MCGIAGFVDAAWGMAPNTGPAPPRPWRRRCATVGPTMPACGPTRRAGVALAHRRLSIVDLSPAGHQPMVSSCGRCVLTYNGEIYNHAELRDELSASGRTFRGHSDTEVLVEACAAWGVEATLRQAHRHVRVRRLGPRGPDPDPGARPDRAQAAVLGPLRPRCSCSPPRSRGCAPIRAGRRRSTARASAPTCGGATFRPRTASIAGCTS